jgi:hypothetical protein
MMRLAAFGVKVHFRLKQKSHPGQETRLRRESSVGTGQNRLGQRGGICQERRPHGRRGRARHGGLPQAARGRPDRRPARRGHRRGQDLRQGRRILVRRSPAYARIADQPRQGLSRSVGQCGQAHGRRGGPAAGCAGPQRQALRRSRVELEPVLRLPQAGLPAHGTVGQSPGQRRQGARRAHPAQGRVLPAPVRQRGLALELCDDQPGNSARDARQQRRQLGARHAHAGRRHRGRSRRTQDPPVRRDQVRGRAQSRAHARQGDLRERTDPAHPVRARDRNGAQAPAADRAALDQQVLYPRPHAGKVVHQVVRRPGPDRIRHLLGQSSPPRSPTWPPRATTASRR